MKRTIYVVLFVILGILVQFLAHAGLEIWYGGLLLEDFEKYGLGFSWSTWFMIHHIGAVALFLAGAIAGYFSGVYWWRVIYDEKKRLPKLFPFFKYPD